MKLVVNLHDTGLNTEVEVLDVALATWADPAQWR